MKKQRPVNLDLTTIKMHPSANASILHRVSGVIMVFAIGILLWTLSLSLSSAEGFAQIQACLQIHYVWHNLCSNVSYINGCKTLVYGLRPL